MAIVVEEKNYDFWFQTAVLLFSVGGLQFSISQREIRHITEEKNTKNISNMQFFR